MPRQFPARVEAHQLEEQSERYLRNSLPRNWTAERPANDYGVDLRVDIFEEDRATGLELLIQLKASADPSDGDTELVRLKVATYNLLWEKLQVAMLVKYIEREKQAYWLLFRDIPSPPQDQLTFTIHIPRANRIEGIAWADIQDYVRTVTDEKLAAMRRYNLRVRARDV